MIKKERLKRFESIDIYPVLSSPPYTPEELLGFLRELGKTPVKIVQLRWKDGELLDKLEITDQFKVQILLNEIRDILQKTNYFSERQTYRLLVRVEKLQRALHRSSSVFDDFF